MDALQRKRPEQASSSGLFLRAAMGKAMERLPAHSAKSKRFAVAQTVVKGHQAAFKKLPKEKRQGLQLQCRGEIGQKRRIYNYC